MQNNSWKEGSFCSKGWPGNYVQSIDSLYNPDFGFSYQKKSQDDFKWPTSTNGMKNEYNFQSHDPSREKGGLPQPQNDEYPSKKEFTLFSDRRSGKPAEKRSMSPLQNKTKRLNSAQKKPLRKDDLKLHVTIEGLKNLIKSEEEMLWNLHNKVQNERSELNQLESQLVEVEKEKSKQTKKKQKKPQRTKSNIERAPREMERQRSDSKSASNSNKSKIKLSKLLGTLKESSNQYGNETFEVSRNLMKRGDLMDTLKKGRSIKEKENQNLINQDEDMRDEFEINQLQNQLETLRKENMGLREILADGKSYERVQEIQVQRIQELLAVLGQKESELATQETYYKETIESLGMKVMELNDQMENAIQSQGNLKVLHQQIKLKDLEIEMTKKSFADMLKGSIGVVQESRQHGHGIIPYQSTLKRKHFR